MLKNHFFGVALSVALVAVCQSASPALAKKGPPLTEAQMLKGETVFWNETNSDEFRQAETKLDFDSMKAFLSAQGIPPSPDFPNNIGLCLPPNYWVNELGQIYGPNPGDNNIVEWYLGWLPVCKRGTVRKITTFWSPL